MSWKAIRSKNQRARLYVYLPASLVEAIDLKVGEQVSCELLDRGEIYLVRESVPPTRAKQRAAKTAASG